MKRRRSAAREFGEDGNPGLRCAAPGATKSRPSGPQENNAGGKNLFQKVVAGVVGVGFDGVAVHEAGAGVPAEEGVVVAGGAEIGGVFVVGHGAGEEIEGHVAGVGLVAVEGGFGAAFVDDAGVVGAVVRGGHFCDDVAREISPSCRMADLVG